jgi:hypothetical protein
VNEQNEVIEAERLPRSREDFGSFLLAHRQSVFHITGPGVPMEVAYVAQTEGCVFLLDGDGFCRAALPAPNADDGARKLAQRCLDAQYVASIDRAVDGLLVSDPKAGRQMLFAKVNAEGKVALIRTGHLLEMRSLDGPMPALATLPETIALDEEPSDETVEAEEVDDCNELTSPFSRERPMLEPLLTSEDGDGPDDLTREDCTIVRDRESGREVDMDIAFEIDRGRDDSSPATVRAPRTVRGFPPPPPIPISSRRGILPRRA